MAKGKQLTQAGINRAMWIMLRKLGGKTTIPEGALEQPNKDDAMQIQYDPSVKSFVFSLHKIKPGAKPVASKIIIPNFVSGLS